MNQWRKGIASWKCGDTLYISVPFTWLMAEAEEIASQHKGKVVAGGPAVKLMGAPWAETPDSVPFDTLSFHNPCATFTSRGCPNSCPFCAVRMLEPDFIELDHWKPAPIVCDNNLLACSKGHFLDVIDSLFCFPSVDFNQGLEARLFTAWHAEHIRKLHHAKVRFAFDSLQEECAIKEAIDICKAYKLSDIGVYCLIGYEDCPENALYRLEKVRQWGIRPNPMRYQPLDATEKDSFCGPKWTHAELKKMVRYYSRLRWLEHIPYEEFENVIDRNQEQLNFGG